MDARDQEIYRILTFLAGAFPSWKTTPEMFEAWLLVLRDVDPVRLKAAAKLFAFQSEWPPKAPAELIRLAGDPKDEPPTPMEAWGEVQNSFIGWTGKWSHPAIGYACDIFGGLREMGRWEIEDRPANRARFVQAYEEVLDKMQRGEQFDRAIQWSQREAPELGTRADFLGALPPLPD